MTRNNVSQIIKLIGLNPRLEKNNFTVLHFWYSKIGPILLINTIEIFHEYVHFSISFGK